MGREIQAVPNTEQKLLMESLGFRFLEELDCGFVVWHGHGIELRFVETYRPDVAEVVARIVDVSAKLTRLRIAEAFSAAFPELFPRRHHP